jgi:thiol-disulfide isomerase/thioredoxin
MKKILIIILSLILIAGCTDNSSISPDNEAEDALNDNQETEDTLNDNQETENSNEPIMVPDFELETLDGSVIKLSEIRDKNVIINFWYTGCTFCVMEMPDLQKLQETYPDDLLLLAINVGETKETIEEFIAENKLNIRVLLDQDMHVAYDYGIRSFPTTIAVNKNGEMVGGYIGMLTYEQMEKLYGFFE